MDIREIKEFLIDLVNRELEEEYEYQIDSEQDTTYIRQLLQAKKYLLKGKKGLDQYISMYMLKENCEKYLNMGKE